MITHVYLPGRNNSLEAFQNDKITKSNPKILSLITLYFMTMESSATQRPRFFPRLLIAVTTNYTKMTNAERVNCGYLSPYVSGLGQYRRDMGRRLCDLPRLRVGTKIRPARSRYGIVGVSWLAGTLVFLWEVVNVYREDEEPLLFQWCRYIQSVSWVTWTLKYVKIDMYDNYLLWKSDNIPGEVIKCSYIMWARGHATTAMKRYIHVFSSKGTNTPR